MPSTFDTIFNDLIDLRESRKEQSIIDLLDKAAELVLVASEQDILIRSGQGIDLTKLGIRDDRKQGRRLAERRINSE